MLHSSGYFLLILAQRLLGCRLNQTDQSIGFLQDKMKREKLLLISNEGNLEDLERPAQIEEGLPQWQVSGCTLLMDLLFEA